MANPDQKPESKRVERVQHGAVQFGFDIERISRNPEALSVRLPSGGFWAENSNENKRLEKLETLANRFPNRYQKDHGPVAQPDRARTF